MKETAAKTPVDLRNEPNHSIKLQVCLYFSFLPHSISTRTAPKATQKPPSKYLKCGANIKLLAISCETYLFPSLSARHHLTEALSESPHRLHNYSQPPSRQVAAFTVGSIDIESVGPKLCSLGGWSSGRSKRCNKIVALFHSISHRAVAHSHTLTHTPSSLDKQNRFFDNISSLFFPPPSFDSVHQATFHPISPITLAFFSQADVAAACSLL